MISRQKTSSSGSSSIFLVGLRCSGKSTVGRILSTCLALPLYDTDIMVVRKAGCSIAEIVEKDGWGAFRVLEAESLAKVAASGGVIAGGGGLVLAAENRALMRASGLVFYLAASVQSLYERMSGACNAGFRPSLSGADPLGEIAAVMAEREALYLECAHYCLDANKTARATADEIMRLLSTRS
ncbi:MAG: shikimate kinase AroL [Desulfovibrio sp.]|jgi:shikimate kinase|nr:shikimate kinase AroL [Desulfovibrio sp.]